MALGSCSFRFIHRIPLFFFFSFLLFFNSLHSPGCTVSAQIVTNVGKVGSLSTSEAGESCIFQVKLSRAPSSNINITVESSNVTAGVPFPKLLVFTSESWGTFQRVVVTGLNDTVNAKGFTTYGIHLVAQGVDTFFDGASAFVPVLNYNLLWPYAIHVTPEVVPFSGGVSVHVRGANFMPGVKVRMGAYPPEEAYYPYADEDNVTYPDTLQFNAPAFDTIGFRDIEIINPDGGFDRVPSVLYYYGNCAAPGLKVISGSKNCYKCGSGEICPGGDRLWPAEGNWNTGEFSGWVESCGHNADDRCAGGRYSECKEGYKGAFCALCDSNYFEMSEKCLDCEPYGVITLYFIIFISYLLLFLILAWVCPDKMWNYLYFIIPTIQLFRIAAQMSDHDTPKGLAYIYSLSSFLTVDVEFLHLGCLKSGITFIETFYINLLCFIVIPFPLVIGIFLTRWIRALLGDDQDKLDDVYNGRWIRALFLWGITIYWTITVLAFKSFFCVSSHYSSGGVLEHERSQICGSGNHSLVVFISALILVVFSICWPIATAIFFIFKRKTLLELEMLEKFGPFYSSVEDFFFLYTHAWLAALFFLALFNAVTPKLAQFIFSSIIFLFFFYAICFFLPFTQLWKNGVVASGFFVAVIINILNVATSSNLFIDEMKIGGSVVAIIFLVMLLAIAILIRGVGIIMIKRKAKKTGTDSAIKGYFMREIRRNTSTNL